jgi:hypothetical protein
MIARSNGSFLQRRSSIVSALTLVLASVWCAPALAGPPTKGNPDDEEAAAPNEERAGDKADKGDRGDKGKAKETAGKDASSRKDAAARKAQGKHAKRGKDAAKTPDPYNDSDESDAAEENDAAASEAEAKSDARAKKDEHAKNDAKAKDDKPSGRGSRAGHASNARPAAVQDDANASKGKHASSGSSKGKKTKKTASRNTKKKAPKKADSNAPQKPCLGPAVALDRNGTEAESLPLVDCAGKPRPDAQARLSLLARPWGVDRPESGLGAEVGRLDAGLLTRLNAIARKFPGKSISIVSGYRPQSRGSLHQSGRAVDLRVIGANNLEVVGFCRTLADTGCGFYPNSSFVHVDVRAPGTGIVHWIDASGPGEAPRYVSAWPPPPGEMPSPSELPSPARNDRAAPPRRDAGNDADSDSGDEEDSGVDAEQERSGSPDQRLPELPSSGAASQPFGLRSRTRTTPRGPSLLPAWDTAPRR